MVTRWINNTRKKICRSLKSDGLCHRTFHPCAKLARSSAWRSGMKPQSLIPWSSFNLRHSLGRTSSTSTCLPSLLNRSLESFTSCVAPTRLVATAKEPSASDRELPSPHVVRIPLSAHEGREHRCHLSLRHSAEGLSGRCAASHVCDVETLSCHTFITLITSRYGSQRTLEDPSHRN